MKTIKRTIGVKFIPKKLHPAETDDTIQMAKEANSAIEYKRHFWGKDIYPEITDEQADAIAVRLAAMIKCRIPKEC